MALNRRTPRQRTLVATLAVVSLAVVTLDLRSEDGAVTSVRRAVRDVFSPVDSLVDRAVSPVGDVVDGILHAGEIKDENAELRQQLAEAEGQLAQIQNVVRENEELRELADLAVAGSTEGVIASVTSLSPSNFRATIQVDRGTDDGVAVDMPVVIGGADGTQPVLVGRISEVSSDRATVLLLQDQLSEVSVRFALDGGIGTLVGTGDSDRLAVQLVDAQDAEVQVGETVVTSGLDGSLFGPGIVVGTVIDVPEVTGGEVVTEIGVEPLADLDRISRVKILTGDPAASSPDPTAPTTGATTDATTTETTGAPSGAGTTPGDDPGGDGQE